MNLPKRKNIRLGGFDYNLPGIYFITLCTKERKYMAEILSDESKWESMSIENRKLLDTLSEENVIKMWKKALRVN